MEDEDRKHSSSQIKIVKKKRHKKRREREDVKVACQKSGYQSKTSHAKFSSMVRDESSNSKNESRDESSDPKTASRTQSFDRKKKSRDESSKRKKYSRNESSDHKNHSQDQSSKRNKRSRDGSSDDERSDRKKHSQDQSCKRKKHSRDESSDRKRQSRDENEEKQHARTKARPDRRDRHGSSESSGSEEDIGMKKQHSSSDKTRHRGDERVRREPAEDISQTSKRMSKPRSKHRREEERHHSHSEDCQREIDNERDRELSEDNQDRMGDNGETSGSHHKEAAIEKHEPVKWEDYKHDLDGMFFNQHDLIRRNTPEYEDFWKFLARYESFHAKKASQKQTPPVDDTLSASGGSPPFDLPMIYDRRYRINIKLSTKGHSRQGGSHMGKNKSGITDAMITRFRSILLHYVDFLQKQKFAKLKKIKEDQHHLPIYQYKEKIVEAVNGNQAVVVAGDTGCGKSTQVPQYLLEAGFTNIACTQPRRIACISLAKRVSYETLNEYGSDVAYQVRFEKTRTQSSRIIFLTEGLLLRQIGLDSLLEQYSVIVIDEVHERHINTDFLLGVLKALLMQRADLKLVLMSATININLFSSYFDEAPVVKVPGRLFPIELQYLPLKIEEQGSKSEKLDPAPYLRVLQSIDHKYSPSDRGDVLMFLSGMSEILSVVEAATLYAQRTKTWVILPLHSALAIDEQDKVFDIAPDGVRKCIVSTNIAETSVTIDGVRFVVDSGKVKEMSYDPKYKMKKLREFWISRASAEQRKGRAGRTGPGVCFRLFGEADYNALQEYSSPEIQRVPLDSLVLQMTSMGLPDARKFPFIEPPSASSLENSIAYLKGQGALSQAEELTPMGEMLAQLPVDVVIGKMLIMASIFKVVDPVVTVAAVLTVASPLTVKATRDLDASHSRKHLESDHGDPITLLNAYDEWMKVKAAGQDSRRWCRRRGLEQQRFYEMSKLKQQFYDLLRDNGLVRQERNSRRDLSGYSALERKQIHSDRKQLNDLRRQQRKQGKKRKVLKVEEYNWDLGSGDDEAKESEPMDLESNIKDLEFRLSNDMRQLEEVSYTNRQLSLQELTLLKVILCSGLYPQVSIADEHNSYKVDSEQAFHTKEKPFVLLHPTSVFALNPEALELQDHDIKDSEATTSTTRGPLSNKHQLLAYVSLLETVKPYLTGALRVPALHTLLLFANSIDTNDDCSRMVFDEWLEVKFEEADQAEDTLSSAVKLRETWQQLLLLKLQVGGPNKESADLDTTLLRKLERVQGTLSQKLSDFLHSDVYYRVRRILSAEAKHLYRGPITEVELEAVDGESDGKKKQPSIKELVEAGGKPHPYKGGTQVNSYLVHNCLAPDATASVWGEYTSCMQRHWVCPQCGASVIVTLAERLRHETECQRELLQSGLDQQIEEDEKRDILNMLRKPFHCPTCNEDFKFTTTEIFQHTKTCKS